MKRIGVTGRSLWAALTISTALLSVGTARGQEVDWQPVNNGLWGGIIKRIVPHPDGFLFALTSLGGFGKDRLFRSSDEGLSWTALDTGAPGTSVSEFVVFPDGEIVASTFDQVLLRSYDNGDTWIRQEMGFRVSAALALHPSGVLFGAEYTREGLLKSSDKGITWQPTRLSSPSIWFNDIDITPLGTILVATSDDGLFRSDDEGETWTNVGFAGTYLPWVTVVADRSIFVPVDTGQKGCMQRSTDDGLTWTRFSCGFLEPGAGPANVQGVAMSESGTIFVADWWRIHATTNIGGRWRLSADLQYASITDDSFLLHEGRLFVGTWGKGIATSADDGETWDRRDKGIGAATVTLITNHPDGSMFALVERDGLFRSEDQGQTWERRATDVDLDWAESLVIDRNGALYVGVGDVQRSEDLGMTWRRLGPDCYGGPIAVSPEGVLYMASYNTIWRFDPGRKRCVEVTSELHAIQEITFANNGDLLVGTASGADGPEDGVFRSNDRGATWQAMPMDPFNKSIYKILVMPNNVVLAGPMRSGLYRSDNDGNSFTVIWEPPYVGYVRDFAAGSAGEIYAATLGGIYRSIDNGRKWWDVGYGIDASRIATVNIDAQGYVYVGTEGAGVYRSATPIILAEEEWPDLHRANVLLWNAPNPFSTETRIGFITETSERVKLTIYNAVGQEIAVLADKLFTPGEHQVQWWPGNAPSGIYFCRLQFGRHEEILSLIVAR